MVQLSRDLAWQLTKVNSCSKRSSRVIRSRVGLSTSGVACYNSPLLSGFANPEARVSVSSSNGSVVVSGNGKTATVNKIGEAKAAAVAMTSSPKIQAAIIRRVRQTVKAASRHARAAGKQ